VDLGELIVRVLNFRSAVPLFGQVLHHSSVPTNDCAGVARSGGPRRPIGRREAALPWTGASTAARLRLFERSLRAVVLSFAVLTVSNATAVAEMRPSGPTASYRTSDPFADFVEEASRRFRVPVQWIRAVIDIESAGDARARSPKGAMGLMQIMPETWAELSLRYDLGSDPYHPRDNILAGTAYLRELHDRYGSPGFLAAYNAGPARYEEHLAGRPLPAETRAYLDKLAPVIGSDIAASSAVASLRPSVGALFVVRSDSSGTTSLVQPGHVPNRAPIADSVRDLSTIVPQATGLFVTRSDAGGSR
jgi:soluble lytic murein transglycosylase-like protein